MLTCPDERSTCAEKRSDEVRNGSPRWDTFSRLKSGSVRADFQTSILHSSGLAPNECEVSPRWESDPRPYSYQEYALPLSHKGIFAIFPKRGVMYCIKKFEFRQ